MRPTQLTRRSLRARLIAPFLVPLLLIAVVLPAYFAAKQNAQGRAAAEKQTTMLGEMLAFSAAAGLNDANFDLVQAAFEWAREDPNVNLIALLDEAGAPIVEHNPLEISVDYADVVSADGLALHKDVLQASIPMEYQGQKLGNVVLFYSMKSFNQDVRAGILMSVIISLVLFGIGIALIFWTTSRITRQVAGLRDAAQSIGKGRLDTVVEVASEDELGDLSQSFRTMVENLRNAQDELRTEKELVEGKIQEAVRASEEQKQYLSRSIDRMLVEMQRFAGGDLTVELDAEHNDEIGELYIGFNRAVANLREMLRQVGNVVQSTASASAEINASAEHLAGTSHEQSAQAHEVAAAVEQMVRTIADNARTANDTAEMTRANGQMAREGGEVVVRTVEKIRELAQVVSESADTVARLGKSSQQIGEIVGVIEEIADQTNLLALNAAIEAARAGEQGRGFAVVADEVRKLAERTSGATKEIAQMIKGIQAETQDAVQAMQRGNVEVGEGLRLADQAGDALKRIVEGAEESVGMVTQIAAASEEQSTTSEQIARSVEMISTSSQDSSLSVSQIARSAEQLNQLAEEVRVLLGRFRTEAEAASHAGEPHRSVAVNAMVSGDGGTFAPTVGRRS